MYELEQQFYGLEQQYCVLEQQFSWPEETAKTIPWQSESIPDAPRPSQKQLEAGKYGFHVLRAPAENGRTPPPGPTPRDPPRVASGGTTGGSATPLRHDTFATRGDDGDCEANTKTRTKTRRMTDAHSKNLSHTPTGRERVVS